MAAQYQSKVKATGYLGFGSFHSDNVEELVAIPDEDYTPPPYPKGLSPEEIIASSVDEIVRDIAEGKVKVTTYTRIQEVPPFGLQMRQHFFLTDTFTFINHGAFGAACRVAMTAACMWSRYCELQPLRFIDRELFPHIVNVLRRMAKLMHAPCKNIVFIPNATYGLNAAINSVEVKSGDVVYMLDIGYGSVKKMAKALCDRTGAELIVQHVPFPIAESNDIVNLVRNSLPDNTKLAIFDHITSNTALVLPVKELVAIAKDKGALTIVDAAHALQNVHVNVEDVGADWYISNCHKWLCNTKGVAVMYAADTVKDFTAPPIISHGYGAGFTSNFIWDGCRDYGGILGLSALLEWWDRIGHEAARTYCRTLLQDAVSLLLKHWSTSTHGPMSMYTNMACVELPAEVLPPGAVKRNTDGVIEHCATSLHAKLVQDALHYTFQTEVPVKCLENKLYLRISACIYNTLDDYRNLVEYVSQLRWDHLST